MMSWIGRNLIRAARFCLYRSRQNKWCWICGSASGMGPAWGGKITCWECYEKWHRFHCPAEGMIVDWRGLGRMTESTINQGRAKLDIEIRSTKIGKQEELT